MWDQIIKKIKKGGKDPKKDAYGNEIPEAPDAEGAIDKIEAALKEADQIARKEREEVERQDRERTRKKAASSCGCGW